MSVQRLYLLLVPFWILSGLGLAQPEAPGPQETRQDRTEVQEDPIRVDVNLITVRFTLRAPEGRFVNTLGRDDFEITEDGRRREIVFFEAPRNSSGQTRRLWLSFLLDVSGSTFATRSEEIIAAQTFLDNVHGFTQVGIFGFTDTLFTFQDFTPDRQAALRAFSSARQHLGRTAIYTSLEGLIGHINSRAAPEDQKSIIVISDGIDEGHSKSVQVAELAQRHNITLHTILVPSAAQLYIGPARERQDRSAEDERKTQSFIRLSSLTGGRHFSGLEAILDFDQALALISDDIFGNLYSIGFYTDDPYRDKIDRQIEVLVNRPSLVVSSLFKDVPERLQVKKKFIAALFGEQPLADLPDAMHMRFQEIGAELDLLPSRRESGQVGLPFRIKISPFTLRRSDKEGVRTQIGILGNLTDREGKEIVRLREFIRVTLDAKDIREGRGILYNNKLFAPPGVYHFKIALLEIATWKVTAFEGQVRIAEP